MTSQLASGEAPGPTRESATLRIDDEVRRLRASGHPVLHLGFGEAGLPVHEAVADQLRTAAGDNRYGSVAGGEPAREAAAGWFGRRGIPTEAEQIIFGPGSKPLLYALLAAIPGTVILPRPSWVSYAAQAALLDRKIVWIDTPDGCGGVPDPDRLQEVLSAAAAAGEAPGVLVLTSPDNPTGTVGDPAIVRRVCELAGHYGVTVISDEIYRDLAYPDSAGVASPAEIGLERIVVTSGLSKSLALGGWRIGYARVPAGAWGRQLGSELRAIASEIWSCLAAPMQHAAAYALGEPEEIKEHIAASRRLHQAVAGAMHTAVVSAGISCRRPTGGFYLYPDFEPARPALKALGVESSDDLSAYLLDHYSVAVLPGSAFGEPLHALRLRLATSQLYGTNEAQRWQALKSAAPVTLPWIEQGVAQFAAVLRQIVSR